MDLNSTALPTLNSIMAHVSHFCVLILALLTLDSALDLAACQAQNVPYLSTVAWCIQSRCTSASQKEILHYWDWVQGNRKIGWPEYASVLPSSEPPLVPEDLELLNSTVRITDESFSLEYGTQQTFSYVERWHSRAG
jgi:hypothetical protein